MVRATPTTERPSGQKILHHQRLLTMHPAPGKRQPPDNDPSHHPPDPTRPHRTSRQPAPKPRRGTPITRPHGGDEAHTPPGRERGADQPPAGSCRCRRLCYVHSGTTRSATTQLRPPITTPAWVLSGGAPSRCAPICELCRNQRKSGKSATPPDNAAGQVLWSPRVRGWSRGQGGGVERGQGVPVRG